MASMMLLTCAVNSAAQDSLTNKHRFPCRESQSTRKSCVLARDYAIADGTLPEGTELRFPGGGMLARLSRRAAIQKRELPPAATIHFDAAGKVRGFWLHADAAIAGHVIRGHEDGVPNTLYDSGALRSIWLAGDEVIDGVPVTSSGNVLRMGWRVMSLGTQRMVYFYEDGRLRQAMLSRDAQVGGVLYRKGDVVRFDEEGQPSVAPAR